MACHEIAALRLGLMKVLGHEDEAERQHELTELGAAADQPGPLWAVVTARDDGRADVVDEDGRARVRLEGYSTIQLPGGLDADAGRARADPRRDS